MRQRSFIVVALAVAVLVFGAVGVYAYDKTRDDLIAKGVTAGGIDVSGLHPDEARTKLTEATSDHVVRPSVDTVKPNVTTTELARRYPRVITVNRGAFELTLYRDLKPVKTYRIAVGRQGLETPAGRYNIQDKQVNPS